jgi:uncharacterized membrane protein
MSRSILSLIGLFSCSSDPKQIEQSETAESSTETGEPSFCSDAPTVTWASWGEGFLIENCHGCHSPATAEAAHAPPGLFFADEDEVRSQASRILARATGAQPDMPPQGGVEDSDRYLLEVWLRCDLSAT